MSALISAANPAVRGASCTMAQRPVFFTLAVIASVRHQDTDYDELLMAGVPRAVAREQVRPAVDRVLAAWQHP